MGTVFHFHGLLLICQEKKPKVLIQLDRLGQPERAGSLLIWVSWAFGHTVRRHSATEKSGLFVCMFYFILHIFINIFSCYFLIVQIFFIYFSIHNPIPQILSFFFINFINYQIKDVMLTKKIKIYMMCLTIQQFIFLQFCSGRTTNFWNVKIIISRSQKIFRHYY